jgi:hypothetical protein
VKERGIILRDHEVRCVLAGAKTQLRRPCAVQPVLDCGLWHVLYPWGEGGHGIYETEAAMRAEYDRLMLARSPFGAVGHRLWVRETWGVGTRPCPFDGWRDGIEYKADEYWLDEDDLLPLREVAVPDDVDLDSFRGRWRPSVQMPRWASRITLEVTGVRVQRLHDISEEDADAEGVLELDGWIDEREIARKASEMRWGLEDSRAWFAALWDEGNSKTAPWSSNSFVWVVEFKVAEVTGRKEAA